MGHAKIDQMATMKQIEQPPTLDLSIVVPVYNEEENLEALHAEINDALAESDLSYETIFVDDGSRDDSPQIVADLAERDPRVVLVRFRRNFGQTAGFAAGFDYARGEIVITLDADRQNDPADIPALIEMLQRSDADVVNGWRKNRQDGFLLRKLPSRIANNLIAYYSGVKLKDRGCSMRAFRREVVADIRLYGEMHRFIPELINDAGYSMVEVPVNHRPRVAGESKYGLSRTFRVLLDLITVLFLRRYAARPMHIFGWIGILCGVPGLLICSYLALRKIWAGISGGLVEFQQYAIGDRPILLLGVLLIILGVQFLVTGLVAELVVRTYHESQNKPIYRVREVIGREEERVVDSR